MAAVRIDQAYEKSIELLKLEALTPILPRKEVIHPHLPVRIPCYDLTPIISPTLGRANSDFGYWRLSWFDGRCVQDPGTYSRQYADLPLLAIPTSSRRVSAYYPNWDRL